MWVGLEIFAIFGFVCAILCHFLDGKWKGSPGLWGRNVALLSLSVAAALAAWTIIPRDWHFRFLAVGLTAAAFIVEALIVFLFTAASVSGYH